MHISVILPTYDRAHTLPRALDSVFGQTLSPMEVLVVDDGSTDDTGCLVRDRYPSCRYLRQTNRGVSSARNLGIEAARGDWLAFLDSDDAWLPGKLTAQVRALEAAPKLQICHTEEIWIRNGRRVNPMRKHHKSGGHIFRSCLPLCVISPSSVLIRRRLLDQIGLFDDSLPACEDYDLWLRLCVRHSVLFLREPQIIKYGGHADQLSRRHWGMDRFRIRALEKLIALPDLAEPDRRAAIQTLIDKAGILAQGADKRGNSERAAAYREKQRHYGARLHEPGGAE